jgi:fatty-acid desaturase
MELDFSEMIASIGAAEIIACFIAFGISCVAANFATWAVNAVAGFFGSDPYLDPDDPDNYDQH